MGEIREEEGTLLRIGKMPYLNCEPFFHFFTLRPHWKLVEAPPSRLGELVREWNLDVTIVPSAVYLNYDVQKEYQLVGELGIAARKRVGSVCLFSKSPIDRLGGKPVYLTGESTTSMNLLKVLFTKRYQVEPGYVTDGMENAEAALLIGDEALRQMTAFRERERAALLPASVREAPKAAPNDAGPGSYPFAYDLAELWFDWKKLPFVFAVWIFKTGLHEEVRLFIEKRLRASWIQTMQNLETLSAELSARHGVPQPIVVEYLTNFQYHLGKEEQRALHEFARELGSFEGTPLAGHR